MEPENFDDYDPDLQMPDMPHFNVTEDTVLQRYAWLVNLYSMPGTSWRGRFAIQGYFDVDVPEMRLPNYELPAIPPLPSYATLMNVSGNLLKRLPKRLPPGLKYLYCSNNSIKKLPQLPKTLLHLSCDNNRLKELPVLPRSLQRIHCGKNPFIEPFKSIINDAKQKTWQQFHDAPQEVNFINFLTEEELRYFTEIVVEEVNKYHSDIIYKQKKLKPRLNNLQSFTAGVEPRTEANWYYGPRGTTIPGDILNTMGSLRSGERGTLKQQKLKLQEKLSRPAGAPGVGGRRKTRKARKTRRNQSKR